MRSSASSSVAAHKGMLWGKTIGSDSTKIQANASMRSIVRRDSSEGWEDYTKNLATGSSF